MKNVTIGAGTEIISDKTAFSKQIITARLRHLPRRAVRLIF